MGIQVLNGINLAVDEINEAGGINGYPVEYISMDDEMNPGQTQITPDMPLSD